MDSDPWITRLAAASRRHHSRSDREDIDEEDESRPEFLCPFCAEDFDVVGLCCHIDEEHAIEAKNGICPVCAKKVGMNLVSHITTQHGSLLKVLRKRRFRKYGSNSTLSVLKKELPRGNLQSLFGGSQHLVSSSNTDPDPLLSSFMSNLRVVDELVGIKPRSTVDASSEKESGSKDSSQRNTQQSPLSDEDQEERSKRCKFVLGLLASTFPDDNL